MLPGSLEQPQQATGSALRQERLKQMQESLFGRRNGTEAVEASTQRASVWGLLKVTLGVSL